MFRNKIFIIIISFYIFWLGILPLALTKAVSPICKNISVNTDLQISLTNPRIKTYLTPNLKLNADNLIIADKKNNFDTDIRNFSIKIRVLPLLSGRVHINKISADDIKINSCIKKDIKPDKDFLNQLENTKFSFDSIRLKNFFIKLKTPDNQTPVIYSGNDFFLKNANRYLKLKVDSNISTSDKTSKLYVNILLPRNNDIAKAVFESEISDFDIEPFGEFFRNFLPPEIQQLHGKLDIKIDKNVINAVFKDTAIYMKDKDYSIIFPDKLTLQSGLDINKDIITINDLKLNSKNINLVLNGKIKDYFGKINPEVNLNITVNKSGVEDFINMLPPFKIEEIDTFKLKKYKFYGDTIGNLSIKGRLPEPELNGNIFINNGILIKPIPNTTKGATVKLKFTGKYINYDVFVPAGKSENVHVIGTQELYNVKYADLNVKSTKNIVLPVAEAVVNPLHEILNFIIGPVPILDIYDGTGNIDINVKGNRKNPHVWGVLNFKNTGVNFVEIPNLKLTNADAVLTFNDKNAIFTLNKGLVNGKDFKLDGTCDLDGKFDFNASSVNQDIEYLYHAIKTSSMLKDIQSMLPDAEKLSGLTDFNFKIYGMLKDPADVQINKNAFTKGTILLKNNTAKIAGVSVNEINGKIDLNGVNADTSINAKIGTSPLNLNAKIRDKIGDINFSIPRLNPNFLITDNNLRSKNYLPYISAEASYKGAIDKIEYEKLNLKAKILDSIPNSSLIFKTGQIYINNNKAEVKKISGYIKEPKNAFSADLKISEAFSENPMITGVYKINLNNLSMINDILHSELLPEYLKDITFKHGTFVSAGRIVDNKLTTDLNLKDIELNYIPLELPIKILNGKVSFRNNNLRLNKINILADEMPILADGEIKDIFNKNYFDIYINSKPQQEFIDKYLNKKIIYPVKIKGDIVYSAYFKGLPNNYDLKAKINMNKDSSIYHYGATIGDIENALVINLDSHIINKKNLNIRNFEYDKVIESQNGKESNINMLRVKGTLDILKNDLVFKDLRIKTNMPADARIFNLIFGKPNIKQGQFTSNLRLNGKLSNPKILGDFHIFETNIPFLDTSMKNIEFLFRDKNIAIKSKGEVLGNDVSAEAILRNKLTKPYYIESADIYAKNMNLNRIVSRLKESEIESTNNQVQDNFRGVSIDSIIAKNVKLKADTIELRNIHAENFRAEASINENKLFNMRDFEFNIAQGILSGRYGHNIKTNDISLNIDAKDINANDITLALFDLRNQIYGDLTGNINMNCNGETFDKCMQTLNGNSIFNVKDGKMPKLGSLEYLLKAGNLVKGGLTGLSINSVIDIITPLKTGTFSDIFGSITIKDGIANNIEITTKGQDLSLFIGGTYNFYTSQAEMEVLGLLSRKISTMFGPIGNMSLNTLFNVIPGIDLSKDSSLLNKINKIPGIEISGKAYRKFLAEIKGNINGDNYVTNFSWIN